MVNQKAVIISQEEAISTVKSFLIELRKQGVKIKQVILFGSFTKNRQHE